jgi:hypothetical protein
LLADGRVGTGARRLVSVVCAIALLVAVALPFSRRAAVFQE